MQLIKNPNFDFVGKRKFAMAIGVATMLLLVFSVFFHSGLELGIDFKGGTLMQFHFEKPVSIAEVRDVVSGVGYGESEIKHFGRKMRSLCGCT